MARRQRSDPRETDSTSLVERVYRQTRRDILSGRYPPSSPLRLQELASQNGVSLIPVREALRMLEAERLVETTPNKGARVAPLSLSDMRDAYRARIVLETEALRQAYLNITPAIIDQARTLKDQMVDRLRRGDETAFDLHRRLHFSFYEPSRSEWLLHFIEILWNNTERYRMLATPLHPTTEEVGQEHARVIDALEGRDPEEAAEALRRHLEHTAQLLVDAYPDQAEEQD